MLSALLVRRCWTLALVLLACIGVMFAPATPSSAAVKSGAAEQAAPMAIRTKTSLCPISICKVGSSIGGSNNRYYAGNVVVNYTHRGSGSSRLVCPTSLTGTNIHDTPITVTVTYRGLSSSVNLPTGRSYSIPLPWRACFRGLTLSVGIEARVFGGDTEYKLFPVVSIK